MKNVNGFTTGELRYIATMFDAHHRILAGQPYGSTREVLVHNMDVESCPCSAATVWRRAVREVELIEESEHET